MNDPIYEVFFWLWFTNKILRHAQGLIGIKIWPGNTLQQLSVMRSKIYVYVVDRGGLWRVWVGGSCGVADCRYHFPLPRRRTSCANIIIDGGPVPGDDCCKVALKLNSTHLTSSNSLANRQRFIKKDAASCSMSLPVEIQCQIKQNHLSLSLCFVLSDWLENRKSQIVAGNNPEIHLLPFTYPEWHISWPHLSFNGIIVSGLICNHIGTWRRCHAGVSFCSLPCKFFSGKSLNPLWQLQYMHHALETGLWAWMQTLPQVAAAMVMSCILHFQPFPTGEGRELNYMLKCTTFFPKYIAMLCRHVLLHRLRSCGGRPLKRAFQWHNDIEESCIALLMHNERGTKRLHPHSISGARLE